MLDIGQLAGYKSEVCCLGLQGSTKTSQYRKDITLHHQGRHKVVVFIVLSIPSASGSPVSSWMCSSVSISGLMEHLIAFTDLSCASQRVSLDLIILSWGWLTRGLYFLQCRKLLRRVVERLPNRHQCCKDFLQTWQTSSS